MTAQTILPANTLSSGSYEVTNSLRFNDDSTDYLNRTPSADGNRKTWTFSTWIKRGNVGIGNPINVFGGEDGASRYSDIMIGTPSGADDTFWFKQDTGTVAELRSTLKLRDVSAWYHLVFTYDSTDGTAADRMKMYVNGVRLTSFVTDTNAGSDVDSYVNTSGDPNYIGVYQTSSKKLDAYLCETVLIDGTALAADSFGEFDSDSGIWKPKKVSGLTFGTNGFYMEYKGVGTDTNSDGMGADTSGNDNHFAVNNLTAADQATDTCTNNFATLNILDNYYAGATLSEGNLLQVSSTHSGSSSGESAPVPSTIGASSGKWYAEIKFVSTAEHDYGRPGITSNQNGPGGSTAVLGNLPGSYGIFFNSGSIYNGNGGSATSYGSAINTGDIVGIYMDLDNNKLYFSDNGSLISATGISITAPASTNLGAYFFGHSDESRNTSTSAWNFGGCSAFAISSAVQDDNGYGNFEYSPNITGDSEAKKFYSLCTKNLAEFG